MTAPRIPETHLDLAMTSPVGMLTTNGPDGWPQTTALWFLYDEGRIRISLNSARQKTKNLMRDPKVTFFLIDLANPFRTLEIRGDASVAPDDDYQFAERLGVKYEGVDLRKMDRPGEKRVVVTIEPVRINTFGR